MAQCRAARTHQPVSIRVARVVAKDCVEEKILVFQHSKEQWIYQITWDMQHALSKKQDYLLRWKMLLEQQCTEELNVLRPAPPLPSSPPPEVHEPVHTPSSRVGPTARRTTDTSPDNSTSSTKEERPKKEKKRKKKEKKNEKKTANFLKPMKNIAPALNSPALTEITT